MKTSYSVAIVNYNGQKFLNECLPRVSESEPSPSEIILVDDALADNSIEIASKFPEVKLIRNEENIGPTA
ncbi:MAG: hypothetical protein COU81_00215 [Candidatus Portnoybacteria bacterium CG10_big_fil_rev_8_21_14_0_10_36_7]|uniref:Glycosyltransferase 2-like domain-containing protein n=1 Tax=Candidatus Portnoybacteria bacterium CG10_big_fil_rev_8_21_14_0_10_36_7 TaxID=1974812 RepID=A0A2M8KF22_9BACT|nr:MAG: hypothetical protein COU81_00215 [Candidatus Portnoybacteria bacterium CG10_big_fil_rev_8_21_14_0_10_36_7]